MSSTAGKIVANAQKSRVNRVYYEKCFESLNLKENGILQLEERSQYDRVVLDESKNEFMRFYGFDQNGSHFDLSLSILNLYPFVGDPTADGATEFKYRLASLEFTYLDLSEEGGCRYSYKTKQLIDYSEKRLHRQQQQHDSKNVYKIGSLSIEIVLPFSLSRIVFNGYLNRSPLSGQSDELKLVSTKLTISAHPSCDKFDYTYRFEPDYVTQTIKNSQNDSSAETSKRLLGLMLEDRIDQPLMFQFHLELADDAGRWLQPPRGSSMMWGAKVRRFFKPDEAIQQTSASDKSNPMEELFIWSKVGHQVHLSRPSNCKRLLYGMVNSSLDYASALSECKLFEVAAQAEAEAEEQQQQQQVEMDFNELDSFASLKAGMKIYLKAFTSKEYNIKIVANGAASPRDLIEVDINGYQGWAICRGHNSNRALYEAQSALWALDIHDRKFSFRLASESLLGGKGNSLIDLNRLIEAKKIFSQDPPHPRVSIPRGAVVSCVAYKLWLKSNPLIEKSIQELDNTRRALAARSVFTNPLSDKHMPLAESQQILREQCKRTCLLLNSCPLPQVLVKHLRSVLGQIFTSDELKNPPPPPVDGDEDAEDEDKYKRFAVRSSAVGEDSLETSAAGQMRTILDARGFDAIVKSIVDCWSSQFEPEAVMYKTQNGLEFNLPMAVVVQELIPCKAAGVATTCDPLTGGKSNLQILANLGLGEGVVSGNKTDTIQLSLESLGWNQETEEYVGQFDSGMANPSQLYRVTSDSGDSCCLNSDQILSLGNLMLWLRRNSEIKDREAEWGITMVDDHQAPSSSSDSSNESAPGETKFQIHLLQSRPLTNLFKLSTREIDHELDYGISSPINKISRANLGEVMPGALCPLTLSYFMPAVSNNLKGEKPFEHQHTYKTFACGSFSFHTQVAGMVLTYTDTMTRFGMADKGISDQEHQDRANMFRAMIGTTDDPTHDMEQRIKLLKERVNPKSRMMPSKLLNMVALDSCGIHLINYRARKLMQNTKFESDLTSIESYIEQLESKWPAKSKEEEAAAASLKILSKQKTVSVYDNIEKDIKKLFARLTDSTEVLCAAWKSHITATLLSMFLNAVCMKVLAKQTAYPDSMASTEVLNDFSTLMQGGEITESGNISNLLNELIQSLVDEGKFEQARQMKPEELYNLLMGSPSTVPATKSSVLFNEFLKKNGHRSFKEFDFTTLTWADDPSYIVKSLATRIKLYDEDQAERERASLKRLAQERDEKVKDILDNKVSRGRALLSGYLLPRCRNGTVRRECSKSLLIEAIAKYRIAFRHLGGLLCLAGRLPSADLVPHLTIEELESFIKFDEHHNRADLSRLLYKCRRRQQRMRVFNQFNYPTPLLDFDEMIELTKKFTGEIPAASQLQGQQLQGSLDPQKVPQVTGLVSCAGCVTGRACVVQSLEDMDQIQPDDILVTYSIDTSWSVYFFTLSGIVTEIGGIVSHGAVVAREYGIPTLCTAVGACSVFKTGQMITLDANQGICYLASDAGAQAGAKAAADKQANGDGSSRRQSQTTDQQ